MLLILSRQVFLKATEIFVILLDFATCQRRFTQHGVRLQNSDGHQEHGKGLLKAIRLEKCVAGCNIQSPNCWKACSGNFTVGKYYWVPSGRMENLLENVFIEVEVNGKIYFRWPGVDNTSVDHPFGWWKLIYGLYVMTSSVKENQTWTCLYLNVSKDCHHESVRNSVRNRTGPFVESIYRENVIREEILPPFLGMADGPLDSRNEGASIGTNDIDMSVTQTNGTLKVCLTWTRPDVSIRRYTVHYGRKSCWFDKSFIGCNEPPDQWSRSLVTSHSYHGTELQYCLPHTTFTYNSYYWIQVDAEGVPGEMKYVITPGCRFPDKATFTYCHTEVPDMHPCELLLYMPWHINTTCLGIHPEGAIDLRLFLQPPDCNSSSIHYKVETISLYLEPARTGNPVKDSKLSTTDTNQSYIDVTLMPYTGYTFIVYATMQLPGITEDLLLVSEKLIRSTQALEKSLRNSSCPLYIASSPSGPNGTSDLMVYYVLAGVAVLGSGAIILSISAILLTKYHRLPLTVAMPEVQAASNSYKSSPDMGEGNLENELIFFQDEWEINPRHVKFICELDHGAFGRVMTGLFNGVKVAIKILKNDVAPSYREDLILEINLMKDLGPHPNIVLLIGACTQREPTALILEYMPYGNLQSFLQTEGKIVGAGDEDVDEGSVIYAVIDEDGEVEQWTISPVDRLSFARQIAKAMEFLGQRQCVHCDLAARNVLLGYNKVVKLSDFGLARTVSQPGEAYHKITHGKLPLKWMALESLRDRIFTAASDVWSFGIFLWELVTMGCTPYPGINFGEFYSLLACGYRMEKPSNCSDQLYELMFRCWHDKPSCRPSFTIIRERLEEMLSIDANYLDLEMYEVSDTGDSSPSLTPGAIVCSSSCEDFTSPPHTTSHSVGVVLHVHDSPIHTC